MPPKYSEEITALFKPRPKLKFLDPIPRPDPVKFSSLSSYIPYLTQEDFQDSGEIPLPIDEARIERRKKRMQENNERIAQQKIKYHPNENENATSNPYNTLFIGGLSDNITENQLKHELESFGRLKQIKFVYDQNTKKRRPYCFVEFENEDSFNNAMKQGSKLKINGQKLIVDCERGRTVENWFPRRLGGGKGGSSREFKKKMIVINAENGPKSKKQHGQKYRGTISEISKRHERKFGFNAASNRRFPQRR